MNRKYVILLTLILWSFNTINAQITVSGFVKDAQTGEVLINANIIDLNKGTGTYTNNYGYFSISCQATCSIQVSYIGYEKTLLTLFSNSDTTLNIKLKEGAQIDEVVVSGNQRTQFNISTLSVKEMQQLPSLSGKPDVIKALHTLPGIQGQTEISSLLIVRGGSPGENLYLLDNTPLIYVNHLGGLLSVFNPDIINDISVYKGGFPAEYGGKLSSVVDITQRNGNKDTLSGSFSIGLTDASLLLESKLGKNATIIFTGRKTLFDALLLLGSSLDDFGDYRYSYGFHDLNSKITWTPNTESSFSFNAYYGDDYVSGMNKISGDDADYNKSSFYQVWGNCLFSGKWIYTANPKLFISNTLSYTHYRLKDKQEVKYPDNADLNKKYITSVSNIHLDSKYNYKALPYLDIDFGLQPTFTRHIPFNANFDLPDTLIIAKTVVNSFNTAVYAQNNITLFNSLLLNIGARAVNYSCEGLSETWIEPRLSATYSINKNNKINASYMQVKQNSHLLYSTNTILNSEVWIPATKDIPSAKSWQSSVGVISDIKDQQFTLQANVYYKEMSNLATYKESEIDLKSDEDWQSKVETGGKGTSYGFEFMLKKNYGNWKGALSYTYSHTTRNFAGINNGKTYLYEYDRPHCVSLNVNRKLSQKWDFNLCWTYQTGLPYTPVVGRQYTPNLDDNTYYEALIYGDRNSARMRDYHRLDIGFNYTYITKKKRKATWTFSVYNVYNRHNAYYYFYNNTDHNEYIVYGLQEYNNDDEYQPLKLYQYSILPIIPSFSYKLYFRKGDQSYTRKVKSKKTMKDRFSKLLYYD